MCTHKENKGCYRAVFTKFTPGVESDSQFPPNCRYLPKTLGCLGEGPDEPMVFFHSAGFASLQIPLLRAPAAR